jgi:hypothetical protein
VLGSDFDMHRNLSGEDRLFRLVLALAVLPLLLVLNGSAQLIGLLGLEPLAAALFGWSPLYALFGVCSREIEAPAPALPHIERAIVS